jgi:3,4-dihydroxy 2-butanone 4-phosphate synthase/GTP cyclohydrolase II
MSNKKTKETQMSEFSQYLSTPEEIIEDARNGKMIVLVDAEDRENEGDLIIPSQMATPEAINFMAKYGRGLICLALPQDRSEQLQLELMSQNNRSRHQTAFTVSIEAREGISTGISAHDRSHTISVAIDPTKSAQDIVTPGHVFPLVAREGGVLIRAGHTEAAVDIARLAGLYPSGVICEIMNDDGTMARLPDLVQFAQLHGLKLGTISDLIGYRRRKDTLVSRIHETDFKIANGGAFKAIVYLNTIENEEHIALVKGDISGPEPVLTRFHAENIVSDVIGSGMPGSETLRKSLEIIDAEGRGVLVLIRNTSATPFSDRLNPTDAGGSEPTILRDYGVGAQIVLDLGLHDVELLSDTPRTIVALDGYDLKISGQRKILG